ncbi:helix-turn-helix domain-containing protein [Psittacicella gerlachiana]|uniref:Insertion element IS150 protein InsJ-like helix-turn-helix domain-containing protein n=1 Tax=Psittacicella gerlachiana TaxID=2028574 RepID=A0A3A1YHH9_9GAMM|nr:helix-turn-helix domain-containing protein [Psittacicella gerlachiana]RIY36699.1 hypothetical protein CKF59_02520 [Psittacicella gerlachiana]
MPAYPKEMRKAVIQEYKRGKKTAAQIAKDFGISYITLYAWLKNVKKRKVNSNCNSQAKTTSTTGVKTKENVSLLLERIEKLEAMVLTLQQELDNHKTNPSLQR